ncbi:MAG: hypothetical protein ACD_87C00183G0001 [uncultured bacterium]|nr:MAG: hypothetical protein ACD_87C00183G0001 [uncultured bacterium]
MVYFPGKSPGNLGFQRGKFAKDHVGAGPGIRLSPFQGFIEPAARRGKGIGPCDDDKILVFLGIDGSPDLTDSLVDGDHFLAGKMSATLWGDLILHMDAGNADLLVIPNRADHVDGVSEPVIRIRDDGDVYRFHDISGIGHHFTLGDQPDIGKSQDRQRSAVPRHVRIIEPHFLHNDRLHRIPDTGGDKIVFLRH